MEETEFTIGHDGTKLPENRRVHKRFSRMCLLLAELFQPPFVCDCAARPNMNQPISTLSSHNEEHMLGHGFYNKHSHEQGKANTYGLPLLGEAVNGIDFGQIGDEFRIADYGSAQGQNSLLPMKTAIAQTKKRAGDSGRTAIPSPLRTPICRRTIGRRSFKRSSFGPKVISPESVTYFVSPAAPQSITKFSRQATSRSVTPQSRR